MIMIRFLQSVLRCSYCPGSFLVDVSVYSITDFYGGVNQKTSFLLGKVVIKCSSWDITLKVRRLGGINSGMPSVPARLLSMVARLLVGACRFT